MQIFGWLSLTLGIGAKTKIFQAPLSHTDSAANIANMLLAHAYGNRAESTELVT